jgi:hypothetical protein
MIAFTAFDIDPSTDCVESGQASSPVAFLGIGGANGMVGWPLDDDHTRFTTRSKPSSSFKEPGADEEIVAGLTAAQIYQLDGYRAIPPAHQLDFVLLVGSRDQYSVTNAEITARFAKTLQANNIEAAVVTIEGADKENVVDPSTEHGQATLQALDNILTSTP